MLFYITPSTGILLGNKHSTNKDALCFLETQFTFFYLFKEENDAL